MNNSSDIIARDESDAFSHDLRQHGVIIAATRSSRRLDNLISDAAASSKLTAACHKGCNYCCYFRVDVSADEVLLIKNFFEKHIVSEQQSLIREKAKVNAAIIAPLSYSEHMRTNIECCFLVDGECSIYPVRPVACRSFHATDADNCLLSYQEPDNLSITNSYIPAVSQVTNAYRVGRSTALSRSGSDRHVYEFQTAVNDVFSSDGTAKRFNKGKRSLIKAKIIE